MLPFFFQVLKMEIIFFYIPSNPPPIAVRNSLTNQFFQINWQFCIFKKKNAKLKRREGSFQLFKLSKLYYHFFLQVLKMEIIFFLISLATPRHSWSGIHWPINISKINWCFCIFSTKKSWQIYIGISILVIPDHICNINPLVSLFYNLIKPILKTFFLVNWREGP